MAPAAESGLSTLDQTRPCLKCKQIDQLGQSAAQLAISSCTTAWLNSTGETNLPSFVVCVGSCGLGRKQLLGFRVACTCTSEGSCTCLCGGNESGSLARAHCMFAGNQTLVLCLGRLDLNCVWLDYRVPFLFYERLIDLKEDMNTEFHLETESSFS